MRAHWLGVRANLVTCRGCVTRVIKTCILPEVDYASQDIRCKMKMKPRAAIRLITSTTIGLAAGKKLIVDTDLFSDVE